MTEDLVKRLRKIADDYEAHSDMARVLYGSADRIESLEAALTLIEGWKPSEAPEKTEPATVRRQDASAGNFDGRRAERVREE